MQGELVVDGATKQMLLGAVAETKRRQRVRLLDEAGNLFGEFVKITAVADGKGQVHYVEGEWPPEDEPKELTERSRMDLRFTPEQIQQMLRRITDELIKGPPPEAPQAAGSAAGSEPRSGGSA